jgi:hypothetical protein
VVEPYALLEKMAQVQPIHDLACLSRLAVHLQLSLGRDVLMTTTTTMVIQETIIATISFAALFHQGIDCGVPRRGLRGSYSRARWPVCSRVCIRGPSVETRAPSTTAAASAPTHTHT